MFLPRPVAITLLDLCVLSHLSASNVLQGYQSIEKSMMMISEFKQWKVTAIHVSVYLAPVIPLQLRTFT